MPSMGGIGAVLVPYYMMRESRNRFGCAGLEFHVSSLFMPLWHTLESFNVTQSFSSFCLLIETFEVGRGFV